VTAMALMVALTAGCAGGQVSSPTKSATQAQPYAGLENRPIRALAPERVEDLLAGRGAGYALAAELNHYPGPTHVLELASELQLRSDEEQRVHEVFSAMQRDAQQYGKQLVGLEAELDQDFGRGAITQAELSRLVGEIATVEGRLRNTHLAAHLGIKGILTPEQVSRYDQIRGYTGDNSGPAAGHNIPATGQHSENSIMH